MHIEVTNNGVTSLATLGFVWEVFKNEKFEVVLSVEGEKIKIPVLEETAEIIEQMLENNDFTLLPIDLETMTLLLDVAVSEGQLVELKDI